MAARSTAAGSTELTHELKQFLVRAYSGALLAYRDQATEAPSLRVQRWPRRQ